MVLLTDVYRNLTSLWIKPWERAFKQFESPVLNVLILKNELTMQNLKLMLPSIVTCYFCLYCY